MVDDRHWGQWMSEQFDDSLVDPDLMGEVEMTTNLIVAASETDDHLSQAAIDRILGVWSS